MSQVHLVVGNTRTWIYSASPQVLEAIDAVTSYLSDQALAGTQTKRYNRDDLENSWDGWIRFLDRKDPPSVPTGLLGIVIDRLQTLGVPYEVQDRRVAPVLDVPAYPTPIPLWPHQKEAVEALISEPDAVARMPPRCFKVGTPLVTFGGQRILVEDLTVGTLLPGPDGRPREVKSIHRGYGPLFRVRRKYHDDLVVNGSHLLPLQEQVRRMSSGVRVSSWVSTDLSVDEWCSESVDRKRRTRIYRAPVVYAPRPAPYIPPYLLGVLLGDGSLSATPAVTTSQPELIQALVGLADELGLRLVRQDSGGQRAPTWYLSGTAGKLNPVTEALRFLGLHGCTARTKFVPEQYKRGSVADRLDLLAGLFDCDIDGVGEWVTASERLRDDVREIALSVGLQVSFSPKRVAGYDHTYWRCFVMGGVSAIPHRVQRKRRSDNGWRDVMQSRFEILPAGAGDFVGFELDGDRLFLMPDGTVQHNSGKTRTLLEVVRRLSLPTLWVAPTTSIVEQTIRAARAFFADHDAVSVSTGTWEEHKRSLLTVCTASGMLALPPEFFLNRQMLVCDEVHHFLENGAWGKKLAAHTAHIYHRKGMSGTFFRSSGDDLSMLAFLGRVGYSIGSRALLEKGHLVPTYVCFLPMTGPKLHETKTAREYFAPTGPGTLGIAKHDHRNDVAATAAHHLASIGRTVLILVATKAQGYEIQKRLEPLFPTQKNAEFGPVEFVSTDRKKKVIQKLYASFSEHQEVKVLIGTSMVGEGVDLPPADALVYAAGRKAAVQYVQALYRVCTAHPGKEYGVVIDFADQHHPALLRHARHRWRVVSDDPVFQMTYLENLHSFASWAANTAVSK